MNWGNKTRKNSLTVFLTVESGGLYWLLAKSSCYKMLHAANGLLLATPS